MKLIWASFCGNQNQTDLPVWFQAAWEPQTEGMEKGQPVASRPSLKSLVSGSDLHWRAWEEARSVRVVGAGIHGK